MQKTKSLIQPYLSDILSNNRHLRALTQERIAEHLLISPRAYGNLERGNSGCSAETLILFLAQLSHDEAVDAIQIWADALRAVQEIAPD